MPCGRQVALKVFLHHHVELSFVLDIDDVNLQAIFVANNLCTSELSYLGGQWLDVSSSSGVEMKCFFSSKYAALVSSSSFLSRKDVDLASFSFCFASRLSCLTFLFFL